MGKRVLLMNAPSQDPCDRFYGWPTPLLYAVAPTVEAIREGALDLDVVPEVFDPVCYIHGGNDEEIQTEFLRVIAGVDILLVSATYDSLFPALKLVEAARRRFPNLVTVIGGPHVDEVHRLPDHARILTHSGLFDYVVAGDGEFALLALLENLALGRDGLKDLAGAPGRASVYSIDGSATTSGAPLPLDRMPFLPLELADMSRHQNDFDVFKASGRTVPTAQIIAQRGCVYSCSFCSERRELAAPGKRSVENIVSEISRRKAEGFGAVFFDDSTFGSYSDLGGLLSELAETGLRYGCLNRFNHLLDPSVVEEYARAGFDYIYCAIEQFDDHALRSINKQQRVKVIRRAMENLHHAGIQVGVSLLFGIPGETEFSVRRTIDFVQEWVDRGTVRLVSQSVLSYHPGTPIAARERVAFDCAPPNRGFPYTEFEEGQWYHPPHVTDSYLERILRASEHAFGGSLVRNRHSWYAKVLRVSEPAGRYQRAERTAGAHDAGVWRRP